MTEENLLTKNYSIEDLLGEFKSYLINKARSQHTIVGYISDIELMLKNTQFSEKTVLKTKNDYERLVKTIEDKIGEMNKSDLKPRTKERKKASANKFFYLLNRISGVDVPYYKPEEVKMNPPKTLTIKQFERIIRYIPKDETFMEARDRAIFNLFFYAGIGQGHVTKVKYGDFARTNGSITHLKVHTKYHKIVDIPLADNVVKELENYERMYSKVNENPPLNSKDIPYFRNERCKRISNRSIGRNLEIYVRKARFKNVNPGSLKLSYIKRELDGGAEAGKLSESMGVLPSQIRKIRSYLLR